MSSGGSVRVRVCSVCLYVWLALTCALSLSKQARSALPRSSHTCSPARLQRCDRSSTHLALGLVTVLSCTSQQVGSRAFATEQASCACLWQHVHIVSHAQYYVLAPEAASAAAQALLSSSSFRCHVLATAHVRLSFCDLDATHRAERSSTSSLATRCSCRRQAGSFTCARACTFVLETTAASRQRARHCNDGSRSRRSASRLANEAR